MKSLDVAIIGGGPAGMAAALALQQSGVKNVKLFERQSRLGGVLPQCIHYGFGLEYFGEELTGPEFAIRQIQQLGEAGVDYVLGAMVTSINGRKLEIYSAAGGREVYDCKATIMATGCRERTRENLEIPGGRPAGIFMAGQAQALINLGGLCLGKRAVIQGSGDIGLIMARRLKVSGIEVVGVFERLPYLCGLLRNKVQCLDHFSIPLFLDCQISAIHGHGRVTGVEIYDAKSKHAREVACDTVLFAAGLIPEIDLYLQAGGKAENGLARVNSRFESSIPGIFLAGNALHINDLADNAAREGEACALKVAAYLKGEADNGEGLPYESKERDVRFNDDYFTKVGVDGSCVCIICPKSCILTENKQGCQRGKDYFKRAKSGNYQKLTRTRVKRGSIALESTPEIDISKLAPESFSKKADIDAGE